MYISCISLLKKDLFYLHNEEDKKFLILYIKSIFAIIITNFYRMNTIIITKSEWKWETYNSM